MANLTTLSTEISDAFSKVRQACALCSLWVGEEASVIEKVKREDASMNLGLRDGIFAASGFCNRHTHAVQWSTPNASQDDGIGCPECARTTLKKFEQSLASVLGDLQAAKGRAETRRGKGEEPLTATIKRLENAISGDAMCPVCETLLQSDKERITNLLQLLESRDFAELYGKSDAMCMPHFVSAMKLLSGAPSKNIEGVWGLLVSTELARLESVNYLLNERMKKYSWDFRNEGMSPEEANAQKIAMLVIAGVEGLYCRPRKTSLRPAR